MRIPPVAGSMPHPCPTVSPDQATVTSRNGPRRLRRGERADHRLARDFQIAQALKGRAVEDSLARRQTGEIEAGRIVRRLERRGSDQTADVLEGLGRGVLDDEARGAVSPAPDNRAIDVDVAGGDAKGRRGPPAVRSNNRRRLSKE